MISPLAYVDPSAKIAEGVNIHPFAYIDADVEIGEGTEILPYTSIIRGTRIGRNNRIYQGSIIGADPQDFRWKGEKTYCFIGDNNTIREHVIINRSIHKDGVTRVGNDSFIMAQSHIAHDTRIGNSVVIGNSVKVAGSCIIGDCSILSSCALVHEKCEIGEWVLIKGGCRVNSNVPPYVIMAHNPIAYFGVNAYILRKGNLSDERIDDIAKCYRHIYQSNTSAFNAMVRVKADVAPSPERDAIIKFVEGHNFKIAALTLDNML